MASPISPALPEPVSFAEDLHYTKAKEPTSLTEIIAFFVKELLIVPLLWLTKYFTDYTNKQHLARLERRYVDILSSTEDFTTWKETARALDTIRGFDTWKYEKPQEKYLNSEAIVEETRIATQLHRSRNIPIIGEYLRTHLSRDANGLSHPLQFRYYTGTKACVEQYIEAVCRLIRLYATDGKGDFDELSVEEPDDVLEKLRKSTIRETLGATIKSLADTMSFRGQQNDQQQPIPSPSREKNESPHGNFSDSLRNSAKCPCQEISVSAQARYRVLYETALSYGRSALMLSGGASLGVYHAGVVRGLFVAGLLPQIITGSSAGAIIGSIVCSRSDEELVDLFQSGGGLAMTGVSLAAFEQVDDVNKSIDAKLRRLFQSGAFMDVTTLSECLKTNVGDLTFREAFDRTGRILNISVSSASRSGTHQDKALLLNYLTAPNVLIWNAVSASCAMPGLFTAVELLEKDPVSGIVYPFLPGQKFYDGSVAHDLPKEGISTLFNVNYFIVSQTNPHVIPFLGGSTTSFVHKKKPRSILKRLWFAGCQEFGHWLSKLYRFNLLPKSGNFAVPYLLHTQPFEGDLTIFPIGSVWDALPDYVNLTANPTVEHMEYVTAKAQRRTWPHLSQIFCVSEIERTLLEEIKSLQRQIKNKGLENE